MADFLFTIMDRRFSLYEIRSNFRIYVTRSGVSFYMITGRYSSVHVGSMSVRTSVSFSAWIYSNFTQPSGLHLLSICPAANLRQDFFRFRKAKKSKGRFLCGHSSNIPAKSIINGFQPGSTTLSERLCEINKPINKT